MMEGIEVTTSDAIRISGVPPTTWRVSLERGFFPAPPMISGRRSWDEPNLICLTWFSALTKAGMPRPLAGGFVGELRKALERDPTAESLNVYVWTNETANTGHVAV